LHFCETQPKSKEHILDRSSTLQSVVSHCHYVGFYMQVSLRRIVVERNKKFVCVCAPSELLFYH